MPRLAKNRTSLAIVHPASESRIEQKANELDRLRAKIKELELDKKALSDQLLKMVRAEGEVDEKGKLRYETDLHTFQVIPGKSVTTNGLKAVQALVKLGVKASVAKKAIDKATATVEYEYVGVYKRPAPKEE